MDILNIFKDLVSIKEEAIKKIEDIISPDAGYLEIMEENCDKVIVGRITMSPALSVEDLEDGEVIMEMHLTFYINDINSKQIDQLSRHGKIIITDCHTNGSNVSNDLWCIQYNTSYYFEPDDEKDVIDGSFGHGSE